MIVIRRRCRCRCRYYNIIFVFICLYLFHFFNYNFFKNVSNEYLLENNFLFKSFYFNQSILDCTDHPLNKWCENQFHLCNSSLIIFDKLFIKTNQIILQTNLAKGTRQGGEDLNNVLNQTENDEYFHFEKGFIQLPCNISFPNNIFNQKTHLSNIFSSLTSFNTFHQNIHLINQTTIAINRYDYVNFYHTITDIYTVYLLCRFFRLNPKLVHILFLDAHPKGNLDLLWSQLFHSYIRLGQLNSSLIFYKELIWSPIQSKSELDIKQFRRSTTLSYFFDFRQYILEEFQIHTKLNNEINCQNINLFFLLRGNYIAHPRNPSGKIQRQLINEKQILEELKIKFQNFSSIHFTFNYFEQLSIEEQLTIITQTDIFLGMHGAGLTHVLFMKSNRFLIELVTLEWQRQKHFEFMASINKINYNRCIIQNGHSTTTETIFHCITKILFQICPILLP